MPALSTLPSLGTDLRAFGLKLKHVRDLCRIGRPLVSLYETPERSNYLEVWADRDENTERWIVFRVLERDLISYQHGRVTLRDLVKSTADGFVFLKDETAEADRLALLPVDELPADILPGEESYYDEKYDPSPEARDEQAILLDGSWEMEDMADVKRAYSQVLAVATCLGSTPPAHVVATMKERFDTHTFEGGYVRWNALQRFVEALPRSPRTKQVHYASPGIMLMDVEPKSGGAARSAFNRFKRNLPQITAIYREMHGELLEFRKLEREETSFPGREERARLRRAIEALVKALGVIDIATLKHVAKTERAQGELMASYFRRLNDLAKWESTGMATFLL